MCDPRETHGLPIKGPWETHGKPECGPRVTHGRPMDPKSIDTLPRTRPMGINGPQPTHNRSVVYFIAPNTHHCLLQLCAVLHLASLPAPGVIRFRFAGYCLVLPTTFT